MSAPDIISKTNELIVLLDSITGEYEEAAHLSRQPMLKKVFREIAGKKKLQMMELSRIFLDDQEKFLYGEQVTGKVINTSSKESTDEKDDNDNERLAACIDKEVASVRLYDRLIADLSGPVEQFMLRNHRQDTRVLIEKLRRLNENLKT